LVCSLFLSLYHENYASVLINGKIKNAIFLKNTKLEGITIGEGCIFEEGVEIGKG